MLWTMCCCCCRRRRQRRTHSVSVHLCEHTHTLHIRYDNNTRARASMVMPAVATTFVSKPKQAKDLLTLLRFADITNDAKLLSYILLRDREKWNWMCVSCTTGRSAAHCAPASSIAPMPLVSGVLSQVTRTDLFIFVGLCSARRALFAANTCSRRMASFHWHLRWRQAVTSSSFTFFSLVACLTMYDICLHRQEISDTIK